MFNVCSLSDFCAFSGSSFLPQHENSAFPVPVNIAPHSGQTRIFILLMCPSRTCFRSARRRAAPFRVHAENRAQIIYQRHVGITYTALPFGHRLNDDTEFLGECRLCHILAEAQSADECAGFFAVHFYHHKSVLLFNFKNLVNLS